jgi:hypothetical protein
MESTMCAISFMRESHGMLVELSDRNHTIEISMIREMVLNRGNDYCICGNSVDRAL